MNKSARYALALAAAVFGLSGLSFSSIARAAATQACDMPDVFERLDCELRVAQMQLAIQQTRSEMGQLGDGAGEVGTDALADSGRSGGALTLLRIYGTPTDLSAQFSKGRTVYTAKVGESVVDGCTLRRIFDGGAQVRCSNGEQLLRLGHSVQASRVNQGPASEAAVNQQPAVGGPAGAATPAIEP